MAMPTGNVGWFNTKAEAMRAKALFKGPSRLKKQGVFYSVRKIKGRYFLFRTKK